MIANFGLGLKELAEFLWVRFEDKKIILPEYLENIESMIKEFLDLKSNPFDFDTGNIPH